MRHDDRPAGPSGQHRADGGQREADGGLRKADGGLRGIGGGPHELDDVLLRVRDLSVAFGDVRVVDGIGFDLPRGGALGIVGESGSGKSMTSLAVMDLLPAGATRTGAVLFDGVDLTALTERRMRAIRGDRIAMVFQDPLSSLNPYYTVGTQIIEAYRSHRAGVGRRAARAAAVEAMERVHIREAARRVDDYPHQFSGGMRQRVMIAMALITRPELIIADEPTTALDVTVQAQILDLLAEVRRDTGAALVLITHDLAVVSEVTDRVVVMRHGRVVEAGTAEQIFSDPRHEYTRSLLDAVPRIDDEITELRAPESDGTMTRAAGSRTAESGSSEIGCGGAER